MKSRERLAGFSLVELMVAVTIGLMIVAAMLANLQVSSASSRSNQRMAEYQTNGRFAIDFMRRELQHTGYAGVSWVNLTDLGTTGTTDYGCGAGFAANIAFDSATPYSGPISGANDSNPFSGSCISSDNYARGDILVLRRAGLDVIPTTATLASNTLYFRSEYVRGSVYIGPTRPASLQTPVEDHLLQTDVYYISKWTSSSTESPKVPALYRMTLGAGPAMTPQLIASGIENMQVQYGIATVGGTRFYDASNVPSGQWNSVSAVRLWLLARSTTAEPDYTNTSTYTIGDQTITASDGFQRQVFPLVVQVRN